MGTGRLEAFSDGVLAIIITIMVLEVRVPHGADFESLRPVVPADANRGKGFWAKIREAMGA